jgi:hypothetical protein
MHPACETCNRHESKHAETFKLLNEQQRTDLQIMLCAGHERQCPLDPWD